MARPLSCGWQVPVWLLSWHKTLLVPCGAGVARSLSGKRQPTEIGDHVLLPANSHSHRCTESVAVALCLLYLQGLVFP